MSIPESIMSAFRFQHFHAAPCAVHRVLAATMSVLANVVVVGGVLSLFAESPSQSAMAARSPPAAKAAAAGPETSERLVSCLRRRASV